MSTLLAARNVTKTFGGGLFNRAPTIALEDFSFGVAADPPSITAVVGESGSGKTTLVRLLLGVVQPTRGEVLYRGKDLRSLSRRERRQFLTDVQVIFQDPYEVYNPFYRVDHVLDVPIRMFGLAGTRAQRRSMMIEALKAVGLRPEETLGRFPHQLSGGQRQRIMVARALLLKPRLIIADEPVSMVDASLRATILDNLRTLNRQFGISVIYITHDLTTAYQISQNIIVLYRGTVAEAGAVERVVKQPKHPYTQLLVGSIPLPDPDQPWHEEQRVATADVQNGYGTLVGCKFVDRCPYVMPMCHEAPPPLFQIDPAQAATCYLHRDSGSIALEQMGDVFVGARTHSV